MGQGLWGSAQAGLGVGMEFARSQAQLEYERGFNERKMALEEEAARLQKQQHDFEYKKAFEADKRAQETLSIVDEYTKLTEESEKPVGARVTAGVRAGQKTTPKLLTRKALALETKLRGRGIEPRSINPKLPPPQLTLKEQVDTDYKKQLIEQSKAITDNYRATAQKSVKAYGFTVEDAAKVLEGYNKYVNDFEKTTQNNIFSLISDKGFDPTTYRPPEPMSLEEYIESVKDVEAGLTGKKTLVGVDKGPPTIAPEDEEFFR